MRCTLRMSAAWSSHLLHSTYFEDGESISLSSRFQLAAYSGCSTCWDGVSIVAITNSSGMSRYGGRRFPCRLFSRDSWHGVGCEDPQPPSPAPDDLRPVCS